MITIVVLFIIAALLAALSGLIGDEVRGQLERLPFGILWLVAGRLPADLRQAVYREEWRPDLIQHMQEADGRPITRLIVGIKYAADMARGAGKVGRELDGVREPEEVPRVHVSDSDSGTALEGQYVERSRIAHQGTTPRRGGITFAAEGLVIDAKGLVMEGEGSLRAAASMGSEAPGTQDGRIEPGSYQPGT